MLIDPGELLLVGRALIEQSQHLLIRRDLFGLGEQRGGILMRVLRPCRGSSRRSACGGAGCGGLGLGVLRVLGEFQNAALRTLEFGGQLRALCCQFCRFFGRARLRVIDLLLFLPQMKPLNEAAQRPVLRGGPRGGDGRRHARFHLRVVLLFQGFDSFLRVAAGLDQVLIRFLEFVLVQIELRPGEIQLVLQSVFLRLLGVRERAGQFGHSLLIRIEQALGSADSILDFQRIRTQRGRMRFDVAQRGREREGDCMVGYPQGRLRIGLFVGGLGEPRQALRRGVGALIDQFRRGQCRRPLPRYSGGGRCGFPPAYAGCREEQHQQNRRYFLCDRHRSSGGGIKGTSPASADRSTPTCS